MFYISFLNTIFFLLPPPPPHAILNPQAFEYLGTACFAENNTERYSIFNYMHSYLHIPVNLQDLSKQSASLLNLLCKNGQEKQNIHCTLSLNKWLWEGLIPGDGNHCLFFLQWNFILNTWIICGTEDSSCLVVMKVF